MASKRILLTPQAERDIDAEVLYIADQVDVDTAIRFFDSVHQTFKMLAEQPGIGRLRPCVSARLVELRQWSVSEFTNYLIFYRATSSGVDIIRILHGARDIDRILDEDTYPM